MMKTRYLRRVAAGALVAVGLVGCAPQGEAGDGAAEAEAAETDAPTAGAAEAGGLALGPVDGRDLPPADLERVALGAPAPDFTALSSTGDPVTLSDFRGESNVILFFYRGHW